MKSHWLMFAVVGLWACSSASTPQVPSDAGDASDGTPGGDTGTQTGVDVSKLAPDQCSETVDCTTPNTVCTNYAEVSNGDPELKRPRCGPPDRCSIVTCPTGTRCFIREVYPGEVICY